MAMDKGEQAEPRKIIHVDMDAFYAAVEQRDFPEWRGLPLVVGGAPDSRGVVATCSYEARAFGIRSAMPSSQARRLCPQAVFVRPRFEVYRAVSSQIRAIFREFTDRVEPLSLDEAYLDVTRSTALRGSATLIAQAIQARIFATTRLTASAGVSYNKFLAKIASERHKPQGFFRILPGEAPPLLRELPIGAFHGVGRATEARMRTLGVESGRDLEQLPLEVLRAHFGKAGEHYYRIARGIDERPVNPSRVRKSCGAETTFQTDLEDPREMLTHLGELTRRVTRRMAAQGLRASSLTLKVKYADFEQVTRGRTVDHPFRGPGEVEPHLRDLLQRTEAGRRKVRLLGVSFSMLEAADEADGQLDLFL